MIFSRWKFVVLSALAAMAVMAVAARAGELVNKNESDVAILGYDTVAYFTKGKPVKGKPQFETRWHDAKWRFSSADHRDRFARDPERYAPRYGGFCAGAMALGQKSPVDPEAWVIVDDKLYLNYAKRDVPSFASDAKKNIAKADANWRTLGFSDK